jgi:type IV secretion system protein VirB9
MSTAPAQRKEIAVPAALTAPTSPNSQNPDAQKAARIARQARLRATQVASTSTYVNAVAVYDYVPGEVYQVYTSPSYVTTLALKPGEKLISKVAGDTTRWVIGDTITGDGNNATVLVVLKPVRSNLRTNLMLSTNQRVYQIDLIALSGSQYQNAISWNYPQDAAHDAAMQVAALNDQSQQTELTGVEIENLNDDYTIKTIQGETPNWLPTHIFDDGRKTYIEFPTNLGTTDAPPLFILGQSGNADLVNYRVKGHYYIVDRLFDRAQLRVGQDPQTIVELKRDSKHVHTASGRFGFSSR